MDKMPAQSNAFDLKKVTFNTAELRHQNFIVHAQCFKGKGKV
jgi:hypothetical protein